MRAACAPPLPREGRLRARRVKGACAQREAPAADMPGEAGDAAAASDVRGARERGRTPGAGAATEAFAPFARREASFPALHNGPPTPRRGSGAGLLHAAACSGSRQTAVPGEGAPSASSGRRSVAPHRRSRRGRARPTLPQGTAARVRRPLYGAVSPGGGGLPGRPRGAQSATAVPARRAGGSEGPAMPSQPQPLEGRPSTVSFQLRERSRSAASKPRIRSSHVPSSAFCISASSPAQRAR